MHKQVLIALSSMSKLLQKADGLPMTSHMPKGHPQAYIGQIIWKECGTLTYVSYLLLCNKSPQNLVTYNNNIAYLLLVHNLSIDR